MWSDVLLFISMQSKIFVPDLRFNIYFGEDYSFVWCFQALLSTLLIDILRCHMNEQFSGSISYFSLVFFFCNFRPNLYRLLAFRASSEHVTSPRILRRLFVWQSMESSWNGVTSDERKARRQCRICSLDWVSALIMHYWYVCPALFCISTPTSLFTSIARWQQFLSLELCFSCPCFHDS